MNINFNNPKTTTKMRKKTIISILSFFILISSFGQDEKILSNQNGFEIAYKAQRLSEGNKDKWLITVTAINKTNNQLYYALPTMKQSDGSYGVNPFSSQFSSKVTVRNATGFLASDGVKIKGEVTNVFTENRGSILAQYDPGRIYNYENTINVKHGDTPIVTVSHNYPLKKLSEFNIEISATLIDGDYKTSCGSNTFSISTKEENNKPFLLQSVNGKQIKWLKTSATLFVKENDTNSTLSYNKEKKTFAYSSSDGINCEWTKL
jgi:hypothetical protein